MSAVGATVTCRRAASRVLLSRALTRPRTPTTARASFGSRAQRSSPTAAGLVTSARAAQQPHPQPQQQFAGDSEGGGSFTKGVTTAAIAAAALAAAAATALVTSRQEDGGIPAFAAEAYSVPIGRASPEVCNCFIEVSRESRMKYEWDQETNMLKLDRVLHGAAFYPHDYGFIPQTLCGDGDPLDVLVLGTSALQPGSIVDVRPLGYMCMEDEKGLDEKVLAVPEKDPRFNHMTSLRDVPEHVLREITNFFETYKQLEKSKWVKVGGWKGTIDTHELIEQTHKTYLAGKRIEAKKNATDTSATAATAAAAAAKRKAKQAME